MSKAALKTAPAPSPYRPETAAALMAAHAEFSGAGPAWLGALRAAALEALRAEGLPTPRLERWTFSNLFHAVHNMPLAPARADIRFHGDKKFVRVLSECWDDARDLLSEPPPGTDVHGDMALWHAANAFLNDGLFIDVPAGAKASLEITVTGQGGAFTAPRLLMRLGRGAELNIIENHGGAGAYWKCPVTQAIVGDNATLRHIRLEEDSADAIHTANTYAHIGRDAIYDSFVLKSGGKFTRNQVHAVIAGESAACHLSGVSLLRGAQEGDNTLLIEHGAPRCGSRQFFRAVLEDNAHGVFQGKIHVRRDAQKTDGYQLSNALLLAEGAVMDTKPELEIYADDVKCSHGTTTGQLDDDSLFYMRARGIPETLARTLLIAGFLAEVADGIADETLRDIVNGKINAWLSHA